MKRQIRNYLLKVQYPRWLLKIRCPQCGCQEFTNTTTDRLEHIILEYRCDCSYCGYKNVNYWTTGRFDFDNNIGIVYGEPGIGTGYRIRMMWRVFKSLVYGLLNSRI